MTDYMPYVNEAQSLMEQGKTVYPETWETEPTDHRLPDERKGPTAFADEYMFAAALRYRDQTLFVNVQNDYKATLRLRDPQFDRIAQVPFDDRGPTLDGRLPEVRGAAVKTLHYGPYFIVLNAAKKKFVYEVPPHMQNKRAIELQSEKKGPLQEQQHAPPESSQTYVVPSLMPE